MLPEAAELDRTARGEAIRKGKATPGDAHTLRAQAALQEAQRHLGGVEAAIQAVADDYMRVVRENLDCWKGELAEAEAEDREALIAAVDDYLAIRHRISARLSLRRALQMAADGTPAVLGTIRHPYVHLKGVNGDVASQDQVEAALRLDAEGILPDAPSGSALGFQGGRLAG